MPAKHPILASVEYKGIPDAPGFFMGSDRSVWWETSPGHRKQQSIHINKGRELFSVKIGWKFTSRSVQRTYETLFVDHFASVEYRDIPGYPGYRVTRDGDVWSCHNVSFGLSDVWKKVKPRKVGDKHQPRYAVLLLHEKGAKPKPFLVSRLVLTAFVGPPSPGMEACHFPDPDPANNRLENLRWGTRKENESHKYIQGSILYGESNPASILSNEDVADIRILLMEGRSRKSIAQQYDVSKGLVGAISRGRLHSRGYTKGTDCLSALLKKQGEPQTGIDVGFTLKAKEVFVGPARYRPIPDFPGYDISSDGFEVRSYHKLGCKRGLLEEPRHLPLRTNKRNYKYVSLKREGRSAQCPIHRLVLEAFVGPRPPGYEVCHEDGNKENNHVNNLRWGTPESNLIDRFAHDSFARGSRYNRSSLTEEDIPMIRELAETQSHRQVAAMYGVSRKTIGQILRRETWKHV